MTRRRTLTFKNWTEVRAELRRLQENGYEATGQWNLAQSCAHLNDWLIFPMDGFPVAPIPVRMLLWAMRQGVGKRLLRKVLSDGQMAVGRPTMNNTVYTSDFVTDAVAVSKLEESIRRFQGFEGKIHPSPLFGAMDKATAEKLQLVHMAHHLGFLIPKELVQPPA
jgi:hypothetical protein